MSGSWLGHFGPAVIRGRLGCISPFASLARLVSSIVVVVVRVCVCVCVWLLFVYCSCLCVVCVLLLFVHCRGCSCCRVMLLRVVFLLSYWRACSY